MAKGKKKGRPPKSFTRDQLDKAKQLLGRRQYPSRVADGLRKLFPDLNVPQSYKLIEAAQREVYDQFAGDGSDPLAATYMFLQSIVAAGGEDTKDRIQAANAIIKLLGMHKLIKGIQDAGDIDTYLAGLMARRAARAAKPAKPGTEAKGVKE